MESLGVQPGQLWYLMALYAVLSVPFLCVSACILAGFFLQPARVAALYGVTMLGSGAGAAGAVGLLYVAHPATIPYALALATATAYLCVASPSVWGRISGWGLVVLATGLLVTGKVQPIRVSEYKGLSYALRYPDAQIAGECASPLSAITVVKSGQIRETPGQISNYPMSQLGTLPEQAGLYFDAGSVSPVHRFDGDLSRFAYLDYVTGAVAYRVAPASPNVAIIGAGGGTEVLSALGHGAIHVSAIEVDPGVLRLLRGPLREFSGRLYERNDVSITIADGRGYLQSHAYQYDLIHIALLDSFTASAAGVNALNENYLYTVEAVSLYLERLTPDGVLAMTCWLKAPPRDSLKLFATLAEAYEKAGPGDPSQRLVYIRSWNTATIVLSKAPLDASRISRVRSFCEDRGFDLCYLPGLVREEANRYVILDEPVHFDFAHAILSPQRENAYRNSLFDLRPATDDCPYFFQFFRWTSLPTLIRGMGTQWALFVEWGYLVLVATLLQGLVISAVLILAPLLVFTRRATPRPARRWVLTYFAGLGLAYMFLEIAFIQRFTLFLSYPVYAVAVVLTAFLVFSGLGSLLAQRVLGRRSSLVALSVCGIVVVVSIYLLALAPAFSAAAGWPDALRIALSVALLAPLAFLMGIPFPSGLQLVTDSFESLLPWAWGVNGCASVVGALLATVVAVHFGFSALTLVAAAIYVVAAFCLARLEQRARGGA
ncbi:MAG: SAM-dependent methyltransferase [Candidatus Hydrogenedentes bacterium]|nr:SAM-dependent methyltransferase [Candidatus Hydrogenedentota bacterium]